MSANIVEEMREAEKGSGNSSQHLHKDEAHR